MRHYIGVFIMSASVKSQLVNLPSVNAPVTAANKAPIHALARYVLGDIKGGAQAHAFRVETIRIAVEQAYKGNADPITEAAKLADGKAKKSRAWHAGFAVIQTEALEGGAPNPAYCMARVQYKGALTLAENKPARDLIADKTHHATIAFFAAFDAVMAEKPAKKEKPVEVVAPVVEASAPVVEADDSEDGILSAIAALEQERIDTVARVLALIKNGLLSSAELSAIDEALADVAVPEIAPVAAPVAAKSKAKSVDVALLAHAPVTHAAHAA